MAHLDSAAETAANSGPWGASNDGHADLSPLEWTVVALAQMAAVSS